MIERIKNIFSRKEGGIVPQDYIIENWVKDYFVDVTRRASINGLLYSQKNIN